MSNLKICLFDPSPSPDHPFREPFDQAAGVTVTGSYATWESLQDCLCYGNVHAVAINLEGKAGNSALVHVSRIAEVAPNCSVLGVSGTSDPQMIISAMRAGCNQFVRWPIDQADLQAALDRIRQTQLPAIQESKIFGVVGSSGGAGATTIACNLVLELSNVVKRQCAIVDMNLEYGEVACSFDVTAKYSVADVARTGGDVDKMVLENALVELPNGVSVLARPEGMDEVREISHDGIEQMFRVMRQMFPFVVLDMPRTSEVFTQATLQDIDRVLIVTQMSVPYLRNATRVYEHYIRSGMPPERLELVLNRVNANFERLTPDEVERHFGRPVFAMIPNDYRRVVASRDFGQPMVNDAPKSPARRAIQQIAQLLVGSPNDPSANPGLIGKLLGRRK